jgi:hypothetical protein
MFRFGMDCGSRFDLEATADLSTPLRSAQDDRHFCCAYFKDTICSSFPIPCFYHPICRSRSRINPLY